MCFLCSDRVLTPSVSRVDPVLSVTNVVLFHARCGGLGTYTRFRGRTRVPLMTTLVLLTPLAVVLVPPGCLLPHGGRSCGSPAHGSGRGPGGARDPRVPCANKGGRVAKALNRRFRD